MQYATRVTTPMMINKTANEIASVTPKTVESLKSNADVTAKKRNKCTR